MPKSISLAVSFLFVAVFASAYVSISSARQENAKHQEASHRTLSELIRPALAISDYLEVQRLLGLVSKKDATFAVVTASNEVLLSDYTRRGMIASLLDPSGSLRCGEISGTTVSIQKMAFISTAFAFICGAFAFGWVALGSPSRNAMLSVPPPNSGAFGVVSITSTSVETMFWPAI